MEPLWAPLAEIGPREPICIYLYSWIPKKKSADLGPEVDPQNGDPRWITLQLPTRITTRAETVPHNYMLTEEDNRCFAS